MAFQIREGMGRRSLRILLVDDHADSMTALSRCLGLMGHEVVVASSVDEASRKAKPLLDLLICDLDLSVGTGIGLLHQLGASRVAALALSGDASKEDQRRSLEAGFREHLVKPVDLPSLIAAIDRVMGVEKTAEAHSSAG